MASSAWMKDLQDKMRKASTEVNTALQPRVVMAKRSIEEGMQSMGLRHGKEIYANDEELLIAIEGLDELKGLLSNLATTIENHRKNLLAVAATERALGETISAPSSSISAVLRQHVSEARLQAQQALGAAQVSTANSFSRFALDMSTPMADLMRTFEETYTSKISPMKKLYASQKMEYFKYVRQAAACEDTVRRSNLESIAEAARPVWMRTSETLRSEIQRLVAYATQNLSEWLLNVAQAEAETYLRASGALNAPAAQAEASQMEP